MQLRSAKSQLLQEAEESDDELRWIPIESVHDTLQEYFRTSNNMMNVYPELLPGDFPPRSDEPGYRTSFGGQPRWIQFTDYPNCEECGSPMPFIGQIDSIGLANCEKTRNSFQFNDAGMIYIFHCCGLSKVVDSSG
ncbi:MAG: hypothetical protein U0996_16715 [Planctomycetaceae bacterium]